MKTLFSPYTMQDGLFVILFRIDDRLGRGLTFNKRGLKFSHDSFLIPEEDNDKGDYKYTYPENKEYYMQGTIKYLFENELKFEF